MKGGGGKRRSDFFSRRTGLIAWLRESLSPRNPSNRSASYQKVEEKVCFSLSSCSTPKKGLSRPYQHLKPIIFGLRFTSSAETEKKKKKMVLERPPVSHNAVSNITHSAIADQDSSRLATTFNAHCTVPCTLEDLNIKFCASCGPTQSRYDTVYCDACMTSCASAQYPSTTTGPYLLGRSAVWGYREQCVSLRSQNFKNSSLAWGNKSIPPE